MVKTRAPALLLLLSTLLTVLLACDLSATGGSLRNYGPAAEIQGDYWFHVKRPLTLEALRGKVVLVTVWRFT